MKIDRLIAIINLLNNNGRMTTKELSERFEVSSKTIQRDMEAIERAGIPITTFKGYNGGYEIIENFKINKSVMNKDEAKILKKLLEGISVSYESKEIKALNEKLSLLEDDGVIEIDDKLLIEFSHWGSDEEFKNKISIINECIDNNKVISFMYVNLKGEILKRKIEPYKLVYKGSNWYVYGFCLAKDDFRLFKVKRVKEIGVEGSFKLGRNIEKLKFYNDTSDCVNLVLRIKNKSLGLLEDLYENYTIIDKNEEWTTCNYNIPEDNWLYGMILSLGDEVEVVSPVNIRDRIKNKITNMNRIYKCKL